jgi:DNA topoisomerase-3
MVPVNWKIKAIDDDYKKKTIASIRSKVNDYDGIIVGTDSDVEGYGIYYLLEQYLGITNKPALRFIEHSLTDGEILKSLLSMTDYHTDPIHIRFTQSFILRSRADWLYGMNGTRLMTLRQDSLMAIGRVKAPTIKIVYDNSMAIENFQSRRYYQLEANYGNGFTATLVNDKLSPIQFDSVNDIPTYPMEGQVISKKTERKYEHAPKLFDLTAIQAEAGQKYGYTPNDTLSIIQSLYETHKVISYPRTQCRFVSSEKAKEFKDMLSLMDAFDDLAEIAHSITDADIKRVMKDKMVVNDAEVQKESHDALLPTSKRPDLDKMNEAEKRICQMIYTRLLAQFLPQLAEDKTQLVIKHGDGSFVAKGKMMVEKGWRVFYRNSKDVVLPNLEEGDVVTAQKMDKKQKDTTPPKRLTQATLINAMRNIANQIEDKELKKSLADSQGIGTPATRASLIEDILKRGYVVDKKDGLHITASGKAYIEALGDLDIASPVFAATMDTKLKKVQRGEANYDDVYNDILSDLNVMCQKIKTTKVVRAKVDAMCPICGSPLGVSSHYYACSNDNCDFQIQRTVCGVAIDEDTLKLLVAGKPTKQMKFTKKDGTQFQAALIYQDGKLTWAHDTYECPLCHKQTVRINRGGAFCDCGLKIFRKMINDPKSHQLTDRELKMLLKKGKTDLISGFIGKSGKMFEAYVVLGEDGRTKFEFQNSRR